MDIRQLETFVEVVTCRNFSKAAENLFLTQPTISAHVNALEKEFKTQLIRRTTKDFEVTEAGEKLYSFALRILSIKEKINEALMGDRSNVLSIGTSSAISIGDLPEIISGFHEVFPEIRFKVVNSDSLEIIKMVNEGTLEIGLVGTKIHEFDLDFIPFTKDELLFVMPNSPEYTTLLEERKISEIIKKPFIMREDNSGTKQEMLKYFSKHRIKPENINVIASLSDPFSIMQCIRQGLGISVLSSKVVKLYNSEELLTIPFDGEEYTRQFYITCSKEKYMSHLVKEFLDYLKVKYSLKK